MRIFIALFLVAFLSGCTVTQKIGQGVDKICGMSDEDAAQLKLAVDKVIAPHEIHLTCNNAGVVAE